MPNSLLIIRESAAARRRRDLPEATARPWLRRDRRVAYLDNFSVKRLHGKSVHCEIDVLIDLNDAHIRFGYIGIDLHFGEIVRNREDDWRLQTGCDRLANIDTARNHYAIDRRGDCAMVKIGFRFIERALLYFQVGFF